MPKPGSPRWIDEGGPIWPLWILIVIVIGTIIVFAVKAV